MSDTATLNPPAKSDKKGDTQPKKLHKFQVLAGRHWVTEEVEDQETGLKRKRDVMYGPRCPAGDVVESEIELDKRFNRPGSTKYKRLGADGDARTEEIAQARRAVQLAKDITFKLMERMSARELIEYAESESIDLRGSTKRDDVLKIVRDVTASTFPS